MSCYNLKRAFAAKNDNFYTRYSDIADEVKHYDLTDKVVYSPCDKPESNFVKYFTDNFNDLGLRYYIATGYNKDGKGVKYTYDGTTATITEMDGDGSYASDESLDILSKCDVVITNPPFSKFRDFIVKVDESEKQFLVIGTFNAMFYINTTLPMFFRGNLHMGVNKRIKYFYVPDDFQPYNEKVKVVEVDGRKAVSISNTIWLTNMHHGAENPPLVLTEKYSPDKYPVYDYYSDAINVDKVKDIPCDYDGLMGVPGTFIEKWCPNQFEILGFFNYNIRWKTGRIERLKNPKPFVRGKEKFHRLLIRKIKQ